MEIINIPFEQTMKLTVDGEVIELIAFKTLEHGNVKFGVEAPRTVKVHREEIYHAIKQKEQLEEVN